MSESKVLALGPFVGSFKQEILTWRPHIEWISRVSESEKIYINSHYNRRFLYNWSSSILPIPLEYSNDEINQKNFYHKKLSKKEYLQLIKEFKNRVCKLERHRDVEHYSLNYIKNFQPCSIFNKFFSKIKNEKTLTLPKDEYILFIPDRTIKETKLRKVYENLHKKYPILVVGDKKTHLQDLNVLLKQGEDYYLNVYSHIIQFMMNAKFIICPTSHWTFIANLQQLPVFSWGPFPGPYKKGGLYNFNNKKSSFMYADKRINIDKITNQFEWVLENRGKNANL